MSMSAFRWPQHLLWPAQYIRAHCDVHVLHVLGHGSTIPKVPLVEEVPDNAPNGKLLIHYAVQTESITRRSVLN